MRLIDADQMKQIVDEYIVETGVDVFTVYHIHDFLDECDAVDAKPVKHGRWEQGVCTNCNFDLRELTDGENDLEQWVWDEGFNHCPNCGAKMDLGGANE